MGEGARFSDDFQLQSTVLWFIQTDFQQPEVWSFNQIYLVCWKAKLNF